MRPTWGSSLPGNSHRQPQVPQEHSPFLWMPSGLFGVQGLIPLSVRAHPRLSHFSTEPVSFCPIQNEAATPPLPWLSPASSQDPSVTVGCMEESVFVQLKKWSNGLENTPALNPTISCHQNPDPQFWTPALSYPRAIPMSSQCSWSPEAQTLMSPRVMFERL